MMTCDSAPYMCYINFYSLIDIILISPACFWRGKNYIFLSLTATNEQLFILIKDMFYFNKNMHKISFWTNKKIKLQIIKLFMHPNGMHGCFIIEIKFLLLDKILLIKTTLWLVYAWQSVTEWNCFAFVAAFAKADSVIGSNLNIMFTNSSVEEQYFHSNKWTILERLIASTLSVFSLL